MSTIWEISPFPYILPLKTVLTAHFPITSLQKPRYAATARHENTHQQLCGVFSELQWGWAQLVRNYFGSQMPEWVGDKSILCTESFSDQAPKLTWRIF